MLIPVQFCIDGNYWQHLGVAVLSLFSSNRGQSFRVIVVTVTDVDPLSEERLNAIVGAFPGSTLEFILFEGLSEHRNLPELEHITKAMYLRLFMAEYLDSDIDKILYLDSDILVCGDITSLWETDLEDAYLGAAPEPYDKSQREPLGFKPGELYVNSGVMLVDVAKWRSEKVTEKFLLYLEEHLSLLRSPDQDVLNSVFKGHILNVGYKWNWQAVFPRFLPAELNMSAHEFNLLRRNPNVVHYTSRYKPWYYRWEPHYKHLYYEILSKTPWADYVPSDRTLANVPLKLLKLGQRHLEWHLPSFARRLRQLI